MRMTKVILTICMAVSFKQNILLGQAEAINGQFSGEGTVDIISYGHYGCSLVIIGVFLLFNKPKLITICCCVFCIAFGLVSMTLSGARSSFIALFLCLILLLLGKVKKRKIIFVLALSLIVLAPLFLHILELVNSNLEENGIYSFSRVFAFLSSSDNVTSSGRDVLFAHGWKLFLSNPVFGYSYLLPDDSYVHNIFIEQFMALGLLGGLLFFVINIKAVSICWHIVKTDFSMILFPVLFIQYLVFGCFSRTIIALIPYWLFLFLSINSYDRIRKGISSHSDL